MRKPADRNQPARLPLPPAAAPAAAAPPIPISVRTAPVGAAPIGTGAPSAVTITPSAITPAAVTPSTVTPSAAAPASAAPDFVNAADLLAGFRQAVYRHSRRCLPDQQARTEQGQSKSSNSQAGHSNSSFLSFAVTKSPPGQKFHTRDVRKLKALLAIVNLAASGRARIPPIGCRTIMPGADRLGFDYAWEVERKKRSFRAAHARPRCALKRATIVRQAS